MTIEPAAILQALTRFAELAQALTRFEGLWVLIAIAAAALAFRLLRFGPAALAMLLMVGIEAAVSIGVANSSATEVLRLFAKL